MKHEFDWIPAFSGAAAAVVFGSLFVAFGTKFNQIVGIALIALVMFTVQFLVWRRRN